MPSLLEAIRKNNAIRVALLIETHLNELDEATALAIVLANMTIVKILMKHNPSQLAIANGIVTLIYKDDIEFIKKIFEGDFRSIIVGVDSVTIYRFFHAAIFRDNLTIFKFLLNVFKIDQDYLKNLLILAANTLAYKIFEYLFKLASPDGHLVMKLIGDVTYAYIKSFKTKYLSQGGLCKELTFEESNAKILENKPKFDAIVRRMYVSKIIGTEAIDNLVASRIDKALARVEMDNTKMLELSRSFGK